MIALIAIIATGTLGYLLGYIKGVKVCKKILERALSDR